MTKKETKEKPDMSVVTLTPDKIHHEISRHIANGVPYIDALVDYSEKNGIEIETIAQIVKKSSVLKDRETKGGRAGAAVQGDKTARRESVSSE
jgi:hypothetical protein